MMSAQERKNWLSVGLISAIVAVVSAWSITTYRVGQIEAEVRDIAGRVAAIYCATVPAHVREGCR